MKRMHIHVAVENIPSSIPFYTKMFGVDPTILKSDYAKWQLEDPKVNFAISARGAAVGINHLGIQVDESSELGEMKSRLDQIQGEVIEEVGTACSTLNQISIGLMILLAFLGKLFIHLIQYQYLIINRPNPMLVVFQHLSLFLLTLLRSLLVNKG